MMYAALCDKCGQKISDADARHIEIHLPRHFEHFHLCGACSGGVIEMLKDMRLIKEPDTIR